MKRAAILLLAAVALMLAACTNSFTPTTMSTETINAETSAKVAAAAITTAVAINLPTTTFSNTTNQKITIRFANTQITNSDLTSLDSAVSIYPLTSAATADFTYTRGTALTKGTPVVIYDSAFGRTDVTYTVDLTSASARLEVVIPGDAFTVSGVKVLDLDGDNLLGESGDDDYVGYVAVTGGTAVPVLGTAVWERLPRYNAVTLPGVGAFTAGATVINSTIASQNGTAGFGTATTIAAVVSLQKFNSSTLVWDTVTTTPAYSAAGVFSLTLPAATKLGEVYRFSYGNMSTIKETTAVAGYVHKLSYSNSASSVSSTYLGGDPTTQNNAYSFAAASSWDSSDLNGYVLVTFSGLGTQGLDSSTATSANFKLKTSSGYVPVDHFVVDNSQAASGTVYVYMYFAAGQKNGGRSFDVFVGPGATDLGATTAASDNVSLGDYSQVGEVPFLFDKVSGGADEI